MATYPSFNDKEFDLLKKIATNSAEIAANGGGSSSTVVSVASAAEPAIDVTGASLVEIIPLSTNITSMTTGLTGTPVNGQRLTFRILSDSSIRTITWGASFVARGVTPPTATVASKYLYVGFIYNSTASVWDCVASTQEA